MYSQHRALLAVCLAALTIVAFTGALPVGTVGAQAGNDATETATETPSQTETDTPNQTATETDTPTETETDTPAATESTTITVSATGQASAEPDVAVLRVESVARADSPADATAQLAANASNLTSALSEAGLADEAVRTTDYSIEEVRPGFEGPGQGPPNGQADTVSYRATQGFEIEVSNTSRAGEIVDVAVASSASSVRGVEFRLTSENRSDLRQTALERAAGSARTQAETLAGAESLTITGVDSISTGEPFFGPDAAFESADAGGTTIDGGPVSVEVSVTITYEAESR